LIDRDTQYFIAESTKTHSFQENQNHESPIEAQWFGANVPKEAGLCERTIELSSIPGNHPCYVVPDLTQDLRCNQLPSVAGSPYLRFYAGTPLITCKGINIGTLFIVDDQVRNELAADQKVFLGQMAQNVMQRLEEFRKTKEREGEIKMNKGLAAFVDGTVTLPLQASQTQYHTSSTQDRASRDLLNSSDASSINSGDRASTSRSSSLSPTGFLDDNGDLINPNRSTTKGHVHPRNTSVTNGDSVFQADGSDFSLGPQEIDSGYRKTFARAADLLYKSLQLCGDSGVVFLDTAIDLYELYEFEARRNDHKDNLEESSSDDDGPGTTHDARQTSRGNTNDDTLASSPKTFADKSFSNRSRPRGSESTADILGSSISDITPCKGENKTTAESFTPLEDRALAKLMRRYPRGHLWSFGREVTPASPEDEVSHANNESSSVRKAREDHQTRARRRQEERKALLLHFPGVQQLLFAPLWDAGSARWFCGCFVWTNSDTLILSQEPELSFCVTFGNCVMAEVSRLDTVVANQQKGDFIGSISHELRSPLHGILASAEFLGETKCDAFQKSLVDTVDSCGRTLLDTINHVLDFSKINSFEKDLQNIRKPRAGSAGSRFRAASRGFALLNIYAETNVAAVCEEVVEGVFAGQIFRDTSSIDFTDVTASASGRNSNQGSSGNRAMMGGNGVNLGRKKNDVEVFLDIEKTDWQFTTQPGALRRVIMNVFGNAIKYTQKGWVRVKLEAQEIDEVSHRDGGSESNRGKSSMVTLTVTDTGKGISSKYLRTRLYTAFAQEDVLAPGTGLGLSLARSIVTMLGGNISVKSHVGKGTQVRVSLPLIKGVPKNESLASNPKVVTSLSQEQDDSIKILQRLAHGKTIALLGFNSKEGASARSSFIGETLAKYVTEWFGLTQVSTWSSSSQADILIADEIDMPAMLAHGPKFPGSLKGPLLVILCSNATQYGQTAVYADGGGVIEFVSKPVGPYKLAKALHLCLSRADEAKKAREEHRSPDTNSKSNTRDSASDDASNTLDATIDREKNESAPMTIREKGVAYLKGEGDNDDLSTNKRVPPETDQSGFSSPLAGLGAVHSVDDSSNSNTLTSKNQALPTSTAPLSQDSESTVSAKRRSPSTTEQGSLNRSPRVLLVDDNSINLRLLDTFMKKRKYKLVESADNGLLAVQAVERSEPYDIIFMDLSMPILNGFEATRAIRKIEQDRCGHSPEAGNLAPSLIIALTGLASERDQTEAFTSGVNLFMTKPVSFRQVGKLLDEWEEGG
ncbi:MAG: hypothetical protein M1830_002208, partial [Pleopsidium flavum]